MNILILPRLFGSIIIAFFLFFSYLSFAQITTCTSNNDVNSLKEAMQVSVPVTKNEVYFGKDNSKIPTFKEMLGVNFTTGLMNVISTYTGTSFDKKQKTIGDVFSRVRYYITCERDIFSDDNVWLRPHDKQVLFGNLNNLNVIVGADGAPVTSSTDVNAIKIYPEIQKDNSIILKKISAGAYKNPYEHYMNYNYLQIKPAADYFNHGIEATLDVFSGDFPAANAVNYKFPNAWFLKEDWGPSDLDIKLSAKAYAMMLARTYAPKASDCATCKPAIEVLEIGNEPYGYTDPKLYQIIVDAFIEGVNTYYGTETANKFKLITGAFQAFHIENTATPTTDEANRKDYINTRIRNDQRCKLDGYNSHIYSMDRLDPALRPIVSPEKVLNGAARSEFMNIRNSWRWLKDNPMNLQDFYLTEFGFDSDKCYDGIGVGSITQAVYNIRSILMMQRYGVHRAFLYEAVDDPAACGYAFQSCGVWKTDRTTSKYQFAALEKFMRIAGDTKFHCCLKEADNDVFSYILEDKTGVPKFMVAWMAQSINDADNTKSLTDIIALNGKSKRVIPLTFDGKTYYPDVNNTGAWCQLDGETNPFAPASFYDGSNFILSAVPIIIPIRDSSDPCANDVIPPVIAGCPQNISLSSANAVNAVATWIAPTATDNCGVASFNSNFSSGSSFPIGLTTVTYTAYDKKNNKSVCTFNIVVVDPCANDVIPPVIAGCPQNISLSSANAINAVATWIAPTATDNCGVASFNSNFSSGASFPIGSTVVTYTAFDKKNNKSVCTFNIVVVDPCANDVTPPVISGCPQNISLSSANAINAVATWTAPTATDNCGVASFNSNFSSGASFPIGLTTVTYTAYDKKNNKATCSFNVTVTPPCKKYSVTNSLNQCGCSQNLWSPYGIFIETTAASACPGTLLYCDQDLSLQYYNDGTANLKGTFRTNTWQPVVVDITFIGGSTITPPGSPNLYLCQTGKPVSVADGWTYFTGMTGTMKFGSDVPVTVSRRNSATQLGIGADEQVTDKLGLSGFFTLSDGRKGDFKLVLQNETPLDCNKNACATDIIAPIIANCPQNITVNSVNGTDAIATWTSPTATDNCSTPTLTSNYNSGQNFIVGTTAVVYTAVDAKNNKSTCAFNVTVNKSIIVNDLAVTLSANPSTISGPYTLVTLVVNLKNIGTQTFSNITVNVPFPAGLVTGGTATTTNGTWIEWFGGGQVFNWNITALGGGNTATLWLPMYVKNLSPTVIAKATLTASTPVDVITSNNSAQITLYGTPVKVNGFQIADNNPTSTILNTSSIKNIYPNPGNDFITIELESAEEKPVTFYFFDAIGRRLKFEEKPVIIGNNYLRFNIHDFEKGIHFIGTDNPRINNSLVSFLKM